MSLPFKLIDNGWKAEFETASQLPSDELLIMSPFIKLKATERLLHGKRKIRVLTRFSLQDFAAGVSDLKALKFLLDHGAQIRGIKNLHSKMYVFGDQRAIVTSANLTEAALTRNHELGFVSDDTRVIAECRGYFERLWGLGHSSSLTANMLSAWEKQIRDAKQKSPVAPVIPGLKDYGTDLGFMPETPPENAPAITTQAFVKFFGIAKERISPIKPILTEIAECESNWALSYPNTRRPRQVKTGNIMFIGRLVKPRDTLIYGRAIAYEHKPGRDDASAEDIRRLDWRKKWGTYIRVRNPEFIAGSLENGISLEQMMDELGPKSFRSTERNLRKTWEANTSPRIALRSKAHMPLTQTAADWLNARFYQAIAKHGCVTASELEKLYHPGLPSD